MKTNPVLPVDVASFENSCGIGVTITPDQIEDCVSTFFVDEGAWPSCKCSQVFFSFILT